MLKEKAKKYAILAHGDQKRKSNGKSMIYHPLAVGEILESFGYDDEVISAGYLHDVVEDTPITIEEIEANFGKRVAYLVFNASEPDKSLPWEERKSYTIKMVENSTIEDIVVILADKIHNIESLVIDLQIQGLSIFNSFNRGMEQQLWYFDGIYNAVSLENSDAPIVKRLKRAIEVLKDEINYQNELENLLFEDKKELLASLRNLHILKYKVKEEGYIKPFIIELLGTPRTGKTTIISNMLDFLKRGGFKVTYYKELVTSGFYKTINHLPLYDRNLAIIEEIIKQLQNIVINQEIKAKHNEEKDVNLRDFDDNGDIVIFDRGIYDRLVWFRRLLDNQEITREQYDFVIEKYKEFLSLINCFISLTASPEIALKRDYVSSLALERRGFLSIENIESYNKALQGLVDDGIISGCYTINTDNKELMPATIEVAQHILSKISKQNNITIIK